MLAAEIELTLAVGRRSHRKPVSLDARIGRGGLDRALCRVVDLSLHGARLQIYSALKRGTTMWLTLPVIGPRAATIIWSDDFLAGCQFDEPLDDESFETLLDLDETLRCDW
ncbi:PilZ domain-containing protein [Hephaestia mangrovi]|uniref:PilZ domain-containing protein n=1 Tax=Hephaestia mangrovi TaxID=2873268 RepID=UPI001CA62668|nr:PilZ domain-containing protein [Hephaestia mangrovi]MBY8827905.1 PilZ domain-containing protein [Hephaestia mangrovi]